MKKKFIIPFLLVYTFNFAQEKIPFIDIDEVSKQVNENTTNGDFEKVLSNLNTISKNDSAYCSIMITKSYYLMQLKKYDKAIEVTNEGLSQKCGDLRRSFYVNKGITLINQKKYDKANEVFDEGIKKYPRNSDLWYNKGVSLEYSGKIKEAIEAYQTTIELNPFYRKPYLQLGNICFKQERISQALMCFNMYILLEPKADNAFTILKSLNNLVQNKNDNSRNPDLQISVDDEAFEEIDLIINSQIAMNKNYKTGNDLNIALIRQNHALIEQLSNFSGNGGFWDTKFVPFYKWIHKEEHFNIFSYTLSYTIKNEKYTKIIKKNDKEISKFIDLFRDKWMKIVQKKKMLWHGNQSNTTFNYVDGNVKSIGELENDKPVGTWEFYNDVGRLATLGNFNAIGNKDGKWTWFNRLGKTKETATYIDGKLNGRFMRYHENGRVEIDAAYKNDNLDGEYLYYNNKGALIQKKFFKNAKLDGQYMSYFKTGQKLPEFKVQYKNDKVEDLAFEYYANGSIYSEMKFSNGSQNGLETNYHKNGKISSKANYLNGELNGEYATFHSNGTPMEVGQTVNGLNEGAWKSYYDNGTIRLEYFYQKGKLHDTYRNYDRDGKIYHEYQYKRGEIIAFEFFDKLGNTIKKGTKKGGEFYYSSYSPLGTISSEGLYDIKGGKEGVWKFYSSNGVLTDQGAYVDNKARGIHKKYYKSGKVEAIIPYKNDTVSGYYVDYYKNGTMESQGWYKDDMQHGEWRFYYKNGTISAINFLHKDLLHGEQQYFSSTGKLSQTSEYLYNEKISDTYFDDQGKVFDRVNYEPKKDMYEIVFHHFNKKPSSSISYVNGVKNGPYSYYDFYGRKKIIGAYLDDELHGEWIWYHDNGTIESKATYVMGKINGTYKTYHDNGQLEIDAYYDFGSSEKTGFDYYKNGNLERSTQYKNDDPNGRKEFYSLSGKLQLVRFYDHGRLIGFSYLDKNATEKPMIPLKKETGKVKAYYDNGNVSLEMEFKNGDLIGTYKEFYYTGQIAREISYELGDYNGITKEYFPSGKVKIQKSYLFDDLHGKLTEFNENGTLKKEENYSNGVKTGVSRNYDKNGKLMNEEIYFNDNITRTKTY